MRLSSLLNGLPRAFLEGRDRHLLAPLTYLQRERVVSHLGQARARPGDRRPLARALALTNAAYGHPRGDELARRLADPATRVVVTGQQPGLFGGPLYTLTKMVAAAKWVEALEEAGEPAVSVFWVATEDHDYREVAQTVLPGPDGARVLDLGSDPTPRVPVGMRTLGPGVDDVFQRLREAESGRRSTAWLDTLGRWYRPGARFGEAFCRLMVHLLGHRSPLLLDAMNPVLKAAQRPLLRRLVERRQGVEEALRRAEDQIRQAGYRLQVKPQPGLSPLFLYRGQRSRIRWVEPASFTLRSGRPPNAPHNEVPQPVAELLRIIEDNPAVVSPGVLARPALQDAVLQTSLQVLGPGELAYMAQAAALYPVLEVEAPATTLRPHIIVLESRQLQQMESLGVGLADLVGDPEKLGQLVARNMGTDFVSPVQGQVQDLLDSLREPTLELDRQLERPLTKTRRQVLQALELFAGKVATAASSKDQTQQQRLRALRSVCLPLDQPQERVVSTSYFPGKHGQGFLDSLWNQLELDPGQLQVIRPSSQAADEGKGGLRG